MKSFSHSRTGKKQFFEVGPEENVLKKFTMILNKISSLVNI